MQGGPRYSEACHLSQRWASEYLSPPYGELLSQKNRREQVKRAIIILLGLAAASCGGRLLAQPTQPAAPPPTTKVGIINMRHLYTDCKRVKDLKAQIDKELLPFKTEKEKLEKLVIDWNTALKNTSLDPKVRQQGIDVIKECRRRLEDLEFKFKQEVSPRLQKDMTKLTEYINDTIKDYSKHYKFDLVLAFGEPETPLSAVEEFKLSIAAVDAGFLKAFFPAQIDITNELLAVLNSR
jgi:Skp family chaperone for outer membrane proteins